MSYDYVDDTVGHDKYIDQRDQRDQKDQSDQSDESEYKIFDLIILLSMILLSVITVKYIRRNSKKNKIDGRGMGTFTGGAAKSGTKSYEQGLEILGQDRIVG